MVKGKKGLPSSRLYYRLTLMRWVALTFGLFIVTAHQLLEGYVRRSSLSGWEQIELVYGVLISLVTWAGITWLRRSVGQAETAESNLNQTLVELNQANQRLEFMLQVNRRLGEAEDDAALANMIVDLFMSVAPAAACSLVRFDSQQRTMPVVYRGQESVPAVDNQMRHFTAAQVLHQCENCARRWPDGASSCAVFALPQSVASAQNIQCVQMRRGNQVYGMLSLYLLDDDYPNEQEQLLLNMMASETAMALESHTLQSRELTMLNRLQNARRMSNLYDELAAALSGMVEALEVAGGVLFLAEQATSKLQLQAEAGDSLGDMLGLVMGLAGGARHAETPVVIGDLEQDGANAVRSLLIAPLRVGEVSLGSLVLWAAQADAFGSRRTQLVATVAGQAALLIENHRLYLHGEHRIAVAERARLAREIHDGLAQTLGYLKLRTAQINNWLGHGQDEQVKAGLDEVQQLLGEAYVNTREAIDGLRLTAHEKELKSWVREIVAEFETLSGIVVDCGPSPEVTLLPEVQVQLQRIIQESFSNIRKHADATHAWLEWRQDVYWLTLHIRDNGCGFDLNDIPPVERHGLRIMRERAELLDADFQIASQEDQGTEIIVRLPLQAIVDGVENE